MASLFKKISNAASAVSAVKTVTSAFNSATSGSQASSAFSSALTQASTNSAINSISGFGGSLANKALGGSGLGSALGLVSGISSLAGLSGLANASGALSNVLSGNIGPQLGIFDNPIRVLERTAGEIFDASGGRFEEMRTLVSNLSELNAFDSFIKNLGIDIRDPLTKIGASSSSIPNPLREFASYNYKITLGILSNQEYNNPEVLDQLEHRLETNTNIFQDCGRQQELKVISLEDHLQPREMDWWLKKYPYLLKPT